MRKNQSSVVEHDQITLNDRLDSKEQSNQFSTPPVPYEEPNWHQ